MHRQHQHMLVLRQLHHRQPQEWSTHQVERLLHFQRRQPPHFFRLLILTHLSQVEHGHIQLCGFVDHLRCTSLVRYKPRAQRLVPSHYLFHGLLEKLRNERTAQTNDRRYVVGVRIRLELVQEPQSLL